MKLLSIEEIMSIECIVVRNLPVDYNFGKRNIKKGFMVTIEKRSSDSVFFSCGHDGIGKTIPEAYNDYINKNK